MAISDDDLLVDSDRSPDSLSASDSDEDDEDDHAAALRLQGLHARVTASNSYEDHVNVPFLPSLSVILLSVSSLRFVSFYTNKSLTLFHRLMRFQFMGFVAFYRTNPSLCAIVTGLTSSWMQYIDALRQAAELEKLRVAREAMNAVFPLTPNMWLEWCEDVSRLATRYSKTLSRNTNEYLSYC